MTGRLASAAVARAWLRRQVWRLALTGTGGLTVDGPLPTGACVVVANHSSHADTAALLAALPARNRPVVVAASDYWLGGGPLRRAVCRGLVDIVPVRRGGGGSADLALAGAALDEGRTVIVFPEGTRSRDGQIGRFHCGAIRLAGDHHVPIVPVGLSGTGQLLPVHGELGHAVVGVHIGAPLSAPTPDCARAAVTRLADRPTDRPEEHPAARADSVIRARVARLAGSRLGVAAVAVWAAAEAFSWPIVPEVLVGALVLALPRRAPVLALTALVASVLAGVVALLLAGGGWSAPEPLVTARMHAQVTREVAAEGAAAVRHQPMSGIPLKAYAAAGGRAHAAPISFALHTIEGRGLRMVGVVAALAGIGTLGRRFRRYYPFVVANALILFTVGLAATVQTWG